MLNQTNKKRINSVIVVEGKTDTNRLKTLFDVDTIETNGSALNQRIINHIIHVGKTRDIILFLDPDGAGETIRKKLQAKLISFKQAFIKKSDINPNSKKIGVAEASNEAIVNALANALTYKNKQESISWDEYLKFELNTKLKRKKITDQLKISECNHKQLFNRLNMIGFTREDLQKLLILRANKNSAS